MQKRIITLCTAAGAVVVAAGVAAASTSLDVSSAPEPDGAGHPPNLTAPFPPAAGAPGGTTQNAPETGTGTESGTAAYAEADADCGDADCAVEIKDGDTIRFDEKFGVEAVQVEVTRDLVTFTIRSGDSYAITTMDSTDRRSITNYNGITFRPYRTEDGRLMLRIAPQ